MKGLSAGLTFFSCSTVCAVLLGLAAQGLGFWTAYLSMSAGLVAAIIAYFATFDPGPAPEPAGSSWRYRWVFFWLMAGCFTIFAVRSFCWLLYIDGPDLRIQSVNNLGDLSLHIAYMKTFANGIALWPDNPIYVFSKLRYPVGVDLFNGLLLLLNVGLIPGLVWVGLLASLATFYALYRWGRLFAVAGFLFNGGVMGFQFLQNLQFKDYQGESSIAWKSVPLAMFVTQRGLLYAIPAALLLLWSWREKFYGYSQLVVDDASPVRTVHPGSAATDAVAISSSDITTDLSRPQRGRIQSALPFWVELVLYGSLPLFHVHTFLALSIVLAVLFAVGNRAMRFYTLTLVAAALLPATFFVWLITDHFGAHSMLKWQPGWVQSLGEFAHPLGLGKGPTGTGILRQLDQVLEFWLYNFGFLVPLVVTYLVILGGRAWRRRTTEKIPRAIPFELVPLILTVIVLSVLAPALKTWWWFVILSPIVAALPTALVFLKMRNLRLPVDMSLAFTIAAVAIFLGAYLFKTAPWEWDNLKLMFWGYFLILPFLWRDFISQWVPPLRIVICIALFGSGFISLFGGLANPGYGLTNRKDLNEVGVAVRKLPVEARFAAYPIWGHPLLLQGRKVVLGYPGHLWTQGFDYHEEEVKLNHLMLGEPDWRKAAEELKVRYIFWGPPEQSNYLTSKKPWEHELAKVASGPWGTIYDLKQNASTP
jgi:hypothetical protein